MSDQLRQAEPDRWVIEKVDGKLLLNGAEIGPGTIDVRLDGLTYRSSEKVEVRQQAEPVAINTNCVFPEWKPGNSDFKYWCRQHFGSDADEQYLAEAVLMLPRKQKLPMEAADEFELHRLLAEERYTVRQLSRALQEKVESPTFMGEPLINQPTPPQRKPLTEWQAQDIVEAESWGPDAITLNFQLLRTIRRTEAAHGIKEQP